MHLIVGLGNPGQKYLMTRHNIGFMAVDAVAQAFDAAPYKSQLKAEVTKIQINSEPVLLAKPQTFMNLSGESVIPLLNFYKIDPKNLLVIHDEIDLPYGKIKIQQSRGHGGHNGIRSIHGQLGHNNYSRIKAGVGRPSHPGQDVASYVLQNFSNEEGQNLPDYLNLLVDAVESFVIDGYQKTATKFN